jgi:hypothetical protein
MFEKEWLYDDEDCAAFSRLPVRWLMDTGSCSQLHEWFSAHGRLEAAALLAPDLCDHVADCAHCRATLLLFAAELLNAPLEVAPVTCADCQDDLAAYVDIEHEESAEAALGAYPHVWWHLWTCADCAETYRMLVALLDAEDVGVLPALPLASLVTRRPRPALWALTLPRTWLVQTLVPQYGAAWGSGEDETVIHESEDDGYEVSVRVRKQDGLWVLLLAVDPPIVGDAVVSLGSDTFRAPITPDGSASIGPIPAELLRSPAGPDLMIRVEPAAP